MKPSYSPEGNLHGRVALVTGASSGIGLAAATGLARLGAHVVLVGRDPERLSAATDQVQAAGGQAAGGAGGGVAAAYRADFTRLDDVRELGERVRDAHPRIDLLVNNAGGLVMKRGLTVDGFETTIQTNHLAGFLLTQLVRERLRGGRIIMTSSDSYREGRLGAMDVTEVGLNDDGHKYKAGRAYGNSKQANILIAREANRRWPDVFATSFHPGQVRTRFGAGTIAGLYFKIAPFLKTPAQGADTLLWLATTPRDQLTPGGYYIDRRLREPAGPTDDPELAARLWDASLAAVGLDPVPERQSQPRGSHP